ncbi:MAG: hypothetical protein IKA61_00645 [Clostridia bacterium]|nr:hypothetical protein [Clostridia bacterium]
MHYHIGTMLIDENFDGKVECPVCRIQKKIDERLTEQYLGEGVMEDDTRKEVNKLGFCLHHYSKLYASHSKLGLALQVSTRLNTVMANVDKAKNAKSAKKQAENLLNLGKTCVVCKYLENHMVRYYKTIAQVYDNVASFKQRIKSTPGFCLEHYAQLLNYSSFAGKKQEEYLADLYEVESNLLNNLKGSIDDFCIHNDYRNIGKPISKEAKESLKNASCVFYGEEK